ncbi:hypothetical protein [Marinilactibacillus sp. Marseille-P9653]|uniref:hypothetical protein n=1 Tax=Marinilactibacillus sp. Marseille-P9653 TaxID=2866583 RepID=UPI001CE48EFC|nr:hypothetical protein [Marinilactibacillus sp. Marseille-P9653]
MAFDISIQKNSIPFNFKDDNGETQLTLEFDKSDDSIDNIYKQDEVIKKLYDSIDEEKADLDSTKELVERCFDSVLGDGSFKKVYAINPSCMIILQYYVAIVIHIRKELDDFEGAKDLEKYING